MMLQVQCSDGSVLVHGVVLAALCPVLRSLEVDSWTEMCVKVPDLEVVKLLTFFRCIFKQEVVFKTILKWCI